MKNKLQLYGHNKTVCYIISSNYSQYYPSSDRDGQTTAALAVDMSVLLRFWARVILAINRIR
ncbi:MAG: hypothetical protein GX283_01235 [Clostridiaceae bacterium]|nr:hypothetical protein [Clostridiaceae bacterium]